MHPSKGSFKVLVSLSATTSTNYVFKLNLKTYVTIRLALTMFFFFKWVVPTYTIDLKLTLKKTRVHFYLKPWNI